MFETFGEGFFITVLLLIIAAGVFTTAIIKGDPETIKTIVTGMLSTLSAISAFWLATRGQSMANGNSRG